MLNDLESCYWRYNSAMELVNMIVMYINNNASDFLNQHHYMCLCEPFFTIIICRELKCVAEIDKFHTMLAWAKYFIRRQRQAKGRVTDDLRSVMDRLSQDLKLHKISPNDLIKIVQPSQTIANDRIIAALTYHANADRRRSSGEKVRPSLSSDDSL